MKHLRDPRISILAIAVGVLVNQPISAQSTANTGGIQITVTDEQGYPIAGAVVQYTRLPKTVILGKREVPAPSEAMLHVEADTDSNGRTTATGLPPGDYALCASVPATAYLDPCVWQQPVQVSVSSGVTTTATVLLQRGVFLNVQVDDSVGLLGNIATVQIWTPPKLLVGVVYGYGAYQALRNETMNGATHSYQLAIPAGRDFSLRLFSTDIVLKDANGAAVDMSGSGSPFHTVSGQDVTDSFTVSGAAQ